MDNSKMKKTASKLATFVNIIGGMIFAAGIVCVVFALLVAIFGDKIFADGMLTLDMDFVKVHLSDEYQAVTGMVKLYAIIGLAAGSIMCFMISYIGKLIIRILEPMKAGRPFDSNVPAVIRKTAWVVLICGGLAQILGIVERVVVIKAYPMDALFASEAIWNVEYVYNVEVGFVAVFFVLLLLSYIFAYGQALQRESDEAL